MTESQAPGPARQDPAPRRGVPLRELFIYAIVAASSLFLMTFVAHMMVGGLVSEQTEELVTWSLCAVVACVIGVMAWDVYRRRR